MNQPRRSTRQCSRRAALQALVESPGSADGWNGPYLKSGVPLDPWKNPYVYEPPLGNQPYTVLSYGKDGAPGGEGDDQDITNIDVLERK